MAKKKGGDYEDWLLRLIEKPEDLIHTKSMRSWLRFAINKVQEYHGRVVSPAQVKALADGIARVRQIPQDVGYDGGEEYPNLNGKVKTRYRDLTGQFGKKGAWVSAAKVEAALYGYIERQDVHSKQSRGGRRMTSAQRGQRLDWIMQLDANIAKEADPVRKAQLLKQKQNIQKSLRYNYKTKQFEEK